MSVPQELAPTESLAPVRLYGSAECFKTRVYADFLAKRDVSFTLRDVEHDECAADELRSLYSDGDLKFPTLLVQDKRLRNPDMRALDRALAHADLFDPGVMHEPHANRFLRFMAPRDAFVSYCLTDDLITLTHIEVPEEKRKSGLGARFALEVFPLVRDMGKPARITCSFMRRVASRDPQWADYFRIKNSTGAE